MTLSESILWSFIRSVLIAGIALGPVRSLHAVIAASPGISSRRLWLALSIFPFFVPELLIGFNYRLTATQLSSGASPLVAAVCTELLYGLLQLARCTAAGVVVSLLMPQSGVTRESVHAWNLLRPAMTGWSWRRGWILMQLAGPWQTSVVAWSLMSLITFQEFETAALMQIDRHPVAWAVWLFDAHAARQPLSDSLRMIVKPAMFELALLAPSAVLLLRFRPITHSEFVMEPGQPAISSRRHSRFRLAATLSLLPGILLLLLWPLTTNAWAATSGLVSLFSNGARLQQATHQVLASLAFAIGSTFLAMNIAFTLCRTAHTAFDHALRYAAWILTVLSLSGSLVLSLTLLMLFRLPLLRELYDSWLPMLIGQTLAVLPRTFAVVFLLQQMSDRAAGHSAELLLDSPDRFIRSRGATILWRITTGRWLMGGMIVAHWCFWDVTVASILSPVQLESVVTRLYNEMHYGRTEALMSLSILAAGSPFLAFAVVAAVSFLRTTWLKFQHLLAN